MSVTVNSSSLTVTVNETTQVVEVATPGPAGIGVPAGGSTGQTLTKSSGTDYATTWSSAGSGSVTGVSATSPIVSDGDSTTPTISHATTLGGNQTLSFITAISVNTFGHITAITGVDASTMRGALGLKNSSTLDVGTGSGTVAAGDDSRLSNARTPVAHSADLVTSGTLGVDRIPTITLAKVSDAGTAAALDSGTGTSNVILGNDARLADARTPVDHSADLVTSGTLAVARIPTITLAKVSDAGTAAGKDTGTGSDNVILGNDSRLTDARTPTSTLDHDASKITTGQLAVARGGTGSATAPMVGLVTAADAGAARTVLGVTNTGSYTGQIETAADKTYTLDPGSATARTIAGFYIKSASGTVTATLKNGSDTVKAASVSDSSGDQSSLANTTLSANGVLSLVLSSNSSALDVIFAVEYTE